MNSRIFLCSAIAAILVLQAGYAPAREGLPAGQCVRLGSDGKLVYEPMDKWGNRIPDYSRAGYMEGGVAIPLADVKATVRPDAADADDAPRIQSAIDRVSQTAPDKNGLRGAVLLDAGRYEILTHVTIRASGVVLRGQGAGENGTVLVAPEYPGDQTPETGYSDKRGYLVRIESPENKKSQRGRRRGEKRGSADIIDQYVPSGANVVTVSSAEGFEAGDLVQINCGNNERRGEAWHPDPIWQEYPDGTQRAEYFEWNGQGRSWTTTVAEVRGDKLVLEEPLFHSIAAGYGGGRVREMSRPDSSGVVRNSGIENLRMESQWTPVHRQWTKWEGGRVIRYRNSWKRIGGQKKTYEGMVDPLRHRGKGIVISGTDCWVRDVYVKGFHYVGIMIHGNRQTVQDCTMFLDKGSYYEWTRYVARYGIHLSAGRTLVQRCEVHGCRHALNIGGGNGPKVFLYCRTFDDHGEGGSHKPYKIGCLYDNVEGKIQSGSRIGSQWRDNYTTFWNCGMPIFIVSTPPRKYLPTGYKWAIGCYPTQTDRDISEHRDWWRTKGPLLLGHGPCAGQAVWRSFAKTVEPRSLYEAQLAERLGPEAVKNSRRQMDWQAQAAGRKNYTKTYEPFTPKRYEPAMDDAFTAQVNNLSRWATWGDDGKLEYESMGGDGPAIADFSCAGYRGGGVKLPMVEVKVVVRPDHDGKDDTSRIQSAIDKVAAMKADRDGMRGAVLLGEGKYYLDGTLSIGADGVVLRGQGREEHIGTHLICPRISSGGEGFAVKIAGRQSRQVRNSAVENLRMISKSTRKPGAPAARNLAGGGVLIKNAEDCWVRNVRLTDFVKVGVSVADSMQITVEDSTHVVGRELRFGPADAPRRGFHVAGRDVLVQRCFARSCRSGFSSTGRTGRNVFLDCRSGDDKGVVETAGGAGAKLLFDNVRSRLPRPGADDRADDATAVFWNCASRRWTLKLPKDAGDAAKWFIGCYKHENANPEPGEPRDLGPDGVKVAWESFGETVAPRSLYHQQLRDRLGYEAAKNSKHIVDWVMHDNSIRTKYADFVQVVGHDELQKRLKGYTRVAVDRMGAGQDHPHLIEESFMGYTQAAGRQLGRGDEMNFRYENLETRGDYVLVVTGGGAKDNAYRLTMSGGNPFFVKDGGDRPTCLIEVPSLYVRDDGTLVLHFVPIGENRRKPVELSAVELWKK